MQIGRNSNADSQIVSLLFCATISSITLPIFVAIRAKHCIAISEPIGLYTRTQPLNNAEKAHNKRLGRVNSNAPARG